MSVDSINGSLAGSAQIYGAANNNNSAAHSAEKTQLDSALNAVIEHTGKADPGNAGQSSTSKTDQLRDTLKAAKDKGEVSPEEMVDELKKLKDEGKLTPEEFSRLLQMLNLQNIAGADESEDSPAPVGNAAPASPAPANPAPSAPPANSSPSPGGQNAGANNTSAQPSNAQSSSGPTALTPGDGGTTTDKVGNTQITVKGGTAEQRAETVGKFKDMYDKSPDFKQIVDSKAGQGLDVQLGTVPGAAKPGETLLGQATINGNSMILDPSKHNGGSNSLDYAATIAHEALHWKGEQHHNESEEAVIDKHGYDMAEGLA